MQGCRYYKSSRSVCLRSVVEGYYYCGMHINEGLRRTLAELYAYLLPPAYRDISYRIEESDV